MSALAALVTLALAAQTLDPEVTAPEAPRLFADHGSAGVQAGYRYVPNPFFDESAAINDPVVSTYLGAPTLGLRFEYFPLAEAMLVVDLAWTGEGHELASGGSIALNAVGAALSLGYKPDVAWWVHPYGLVGLDQITVFVADRILTSPQPLNSLHSAFGLHAAVGALAPQLVPGWSWLGAFAELRYTFAPMTQRGRSFLVLGAAAVVGLQLQFEAGILGGASRPGF